jgi:DNA-binding NarL/FixJ family response regulator
MSIKVLIADDHEVVRSGLKSLLSGPDIEVVGQAAGGDEAFRLAQKCKPNVVLLDIRMADGDGLEALDKIRAAMPATRVIMLSTFDNPTYMARAAALGASDYLLKSTSRDDLRTAIKAAAAGESPLRTELRRLAGTASPAQVELSDDVSLTQRESQVLRHMALGLSNKEIGRALGISVDTVKEHVQNILRKVQATDRTQAAVWAVRKGLV